MRKTLLKGQVVEQKIKKKFSIELKMNAFSYGIVYLHN